MPANAAIVVSPYALHRHPHYWENLEQFDPERFTLEMSDRRPRHAYIPFGGGRSTKPTSARIPFRWTEKAKKSTWPMENWIAAHGPSPLSYSL